MRGSSLIGQGPAIRHMRAEIERAAKFPSPVLISGETGSGKGLVARVIHEMSPLKDSPLVRVSCLPDLRMESRKGSGNQQVDCWGERAVSLLKSRTSATLYLDKLSDMSLEAQAKLLWLLKESESLALDVENAKKRTIRVISSTSKNLAREIEEGNFREDLYFRISVIPIEVSPLRKCKEDIPLLVDHFIQLFCEENNRPPRTISEGAVKAMMSYHWPGNVRELKNLVERLVTMTDEKTIKETHVMPLLSEAKVVTADKPLSDLVGDFEKSLIIQELNRTGWNVSQAASRLGIDRANLHRKMRQHGLKRATRS